MTVQDTTGFNPALTRGMSVVFRADPRQPLMTVKEVRMRGVVPYYTVVWLDGFGRRREGEFCAADLMEADLRSW